MIPLLHTPAGLAQLPDELLLSILHQFSAPLSLLAVSDEPQLPIRGTNIDWFVGRETLRRLCLVSSKMCPLARFLLYRDVTLLSVVDLGLLFRTLVENHNGTHREIISTLACFVDLNSTNIEMKSQSCWPNIDSAGLSQMELLANVVLQALYLSPLAAVFERDQNSNVMDAHMTPGCSSDGSSSTTESSISSRGGSQLASDTRTLEAPWNQEHENDRRKNPRHAPLALLGFVTAQRLFAAVLGCTPNLSKLTIKEPSHDFTEATQMIEQLRENPYMKGKVLSRLERFSTYNDTTFGSHVSLADLSSFKELHTLKEINLASWPDYHFSKSQCQIYPQVETLIIRYILEPGRHLAAIMTQFPRLRRLDINAVSWHDSDIDKINASLPSLTDSLKSVTLHGSDHKCGVSHNSSILQCLHQLVNVTELSIDTGLLYTHLPSNGASSDIWERLPAGLERLRLFGTGLDIRSRQVTIFDRFPV